MTILVSIGESVPQVGITLRKSRLALKLTSDRAHLLRLVFPGSLSLVREVDMRYLRFREDKATYL